MHGKALWPAAKAALALAVLILTTTGALAATEKILHSFDVYDGGDPSAGLVFDAQGNLYGTTIGGGPGGHGTVFELSPASGGGWTETVLYGFTGAQDGSGPFATVIFDAQGNLYGTTEEGGAHGYGVVFELTPGSGGKWTEAVLHSFAGGTDGANPEADLAFDSKGNLYGTTPTGGQPFGLGTVFKLTPVGGGSWKETIIRRFQGGSDGNAPVAGVIFDAAGNLYGTTTSGGSAGCGGSGCGIVFQLKPTDTGRWTGHVLHRFNGGADGSAPLSDVIFDTSGNIYGTTAAGGNSGCVDGFGCGTVFELSPMSGSGWKEHVIYRFKGHTDGANPRGLVLDTAGHLYGTTYAGGTVGCGFVGCGTVFELEPSGPSQQAKWQNTVLHIFRPGRSGDGDGSTPVAGPILDAAGDVYGTTAKGGVANSGTVFEITP
jgi:uncharacterized repeat protein (TIGR03803 family)